MTDTPLNVLLADPCENTRKTIRSLIQDFAPEAMIFEASTTDEALQLAEQDRYQLALLELHSPGLDGTLLLHTLKNLALTQRPNHIVLYSELLDPEASSRSNRLLSFVSKPFQPEQLRELLIARLRPPETKPDNEDLPQIDASVFQAFTQGLNQYFTKSLGEDIGRDRITLRQKEVLEAEVGASIDLSSRVLQGKLLILTDRKCFLSLCGKRMKAPQSEITPENAVIFGELCREVYGFAKMILNDRGFAFPEASPSPLRGKQCHQPPGGSERICVLQRFQTEHGELTMEIQILRVDRSAVHSS